MFRPTLMMLGCTARKPLKHITHGAGNDQPSTYLNEDEMRGATRFRPKDTLSYILFSKRCATLGEKSD